MTCLVALDGPAGSGKSTTSRAVARALDLGYLDSGAMYRALTWLVLHEGLELHDVAGIAALAHRADLELSTDPDDQVVRVNGHDVTAAIRGPEVTAAVSAVSAVPELRAVLVQAQRALAEAQPRGCVVEGRDIASVVLPHAPVKVFLTADVEARALRRAAETDAAVGDTAESLARRDALDSSRATSPLVVADGCATIDSTHLTVDEVVELVVGLCEDAGCLPPELTAAAE